MKTLEERRLALRTLALPLAAALTTRVGPAVATVPGTGPRLPVIDVWKDPSCGCCASWVDHLLEAGFRVRTFDVGNTAARARLGMPTAFGACHTAQVDGYVIEGHVPAEDIRRLLAERPPAIGLAVRGMPIGSPGMDGPEYGGRRDAYPVLLVLKDGSSRIFRSYPGGTSR